MELNLKKSVVLIFLIFIINVAFAQKTTYTNGLLSYENSEKNIKKNIGKNVTLTYDEFFKSYTVVYTDVNGYKKKMTFTHDGSQFDQYTCNGIIFYVIMPDVSLGYAKNGNGFITFSDLRKTLYGGTHISYKITKLKLN